MNETIQIFLWGNLWILLTVVFFGRWLTARARSPHIWTYFIIISLLPLVIALFFPMNLWLTDSALSTFSLQSQVQEFGEQKFPLSGGLSIATLLAWLYAVISGLKILSLVLRWVRLQFIRLEPTETRGVYKTKADVPALALSWPRRCVVMPASQNSLSTQSRTQIIAHERAHLKHYDPEITLLYLILKNLFWANPAFGWLVTGWRDAAEMRADRVVTAGIEMPARKAYAKTIIDALARKNGERPRQWPSSYLTSNSLRSVKMRLSEIMTIEPRNGNSLYKSLAMLGGLALSLSGVTVLTANAAPGSQSELRPLTRVPPLMPATCPNLDLNSVEIKSFSSKIDGIEKSYRGAIVGTVKLSFDINVSGKTENINVLKSNNVCFDMPSVKSVAQWTYSSGANKKGVENMIKFLLTEDSTGKLTLEDNLREFAAP